MSMMRKSGLFLRVAVLVLLGCFLAAAPGRAAGFPEKPVQMVIGFGAGGDADVFGRLLARALEKQFGQPVVVSNMAGAAGTIGTAHVRASEPDGYTILFTHWGMLTNELFSMIDYNVLDEFIVPGISVIDPTGIIVGNAKLGRFKNIGELMAKAKEEPEGVKISMDTGAMVHLHWLILEKENGVKFQFIDTGNMANRVAALMSGQLDAMLAQYIAVKDMIDSGEFVNLGAVAPERNPNYKDVPTLDELGAKGLAEVSLKYFHILLPKNTPPDVVDAYKKALKAASEDPESIEMFRKAYAEIVYMSEDESRAFISKMREIVQRYKDLVPVVE